MAPSEEAAQGNVVGTGRDAAPEGVVGRSAGAAVVPDLVPSDDVDEGARLEFLYDESCSGLPRVVGGCGTEVKPVSAHCA